MSKTKLVDGMLCTACFAPLPVKTQDGGIVRCDYCNTEHALSREVRQVKAEDSQSFRVRLYKALAMAFDSSEELDKLIVIFSGELPRHSLSPDCIAGKTVDTKALQLVLWANRRSCVQTLVDVAFSLRPRLDL
jgi:hypothetical protein